MKSYIGLSKESWFFFFFRCIWLACCLKVIFLLFQVLVTHQSSHMIKFKFYLCQYFNCINAVYEIRTLCLVKQQVASYQSIYSVLAPVPSSAAICNFGFCGSWVLVCFSWFFLGKWRGKMSTRSLLWRRWATAFIVQHHWSCQSSTRINPAGCLWLDFLYHSDSNCLVFSAGWL